MSAPLPTRHAFLIAAIRSLEGRPQVAVHADPGRFLPLVAAGGLGAAGLLVRNFAEVPAALQHAKDAARQGRAVLVNVHLGATDFRKGSISM